MGYGTLEGCRHMTSSCGRIVCFFFSSSDRFLARVATKLTSLDISAGVVILTGNSYLNLKINKIKL